MSGLVLLEMDSVCVRYSFIRNGFSVSGLILLEMDSVCFIGLVLLEMDSEC